MMKLLVFLLFIGKKFYSEVFSDNEVCGNCFNL